MLLSMALEANSSEGEVEPSNNSVRTGLIIQQLHARSSVMNPEVAIARTEFEKSLKEEQRARAELEAAEQDVPGWMSQFPAGILRQAVSTVENSIPTSAVLEKQSEEVDRKLIVNQGQQQHQPTEINSSSNQSPQKPVPTAQVAAPPATSKVQHSDDTLLGRLEQDFAAALSEATILRRKAALHRAEAKLAEGDCGLSSCVHEPAQHTSSDEIKALAKQKLARRAAAGGGLTEKDKQLLGELFKRNTVLHKVSTEKQVLAKQVKRQVHEATRKLVATAKAVLQRDAAAQARAEHAQIAGVRKQDLKRQESRAAMTQAASQLLRLLHGSNDPWLVKTLKHIAKDAAKVHSRT